MSDTKSPPKFSFIGKIETLLIIALALAFLLWAIPTCRTTPKSAEENSANSPSSQFSEGIPIYIDADSLNMRDAPGLQSEIIAKLSFGEQVFLP